MNYKDFWEILNSGRRTSSENDENKSVSAAVASQEPNSSTEPEYSCDTMAGMSEQNALRGDALYTEENADEGWREEEIDSDDASGSEVQYSSLNPESYSYLDEGENTGESFFLQEQDELDENAYPEFESLSRESEETEDLDDSDLYDVHSLFDYDEDEPAIDTDKEIVKKAEESGAVASEITAEVEAEEPREVALETVQSAESVEAAQKGSVETVQSVETVEAAQKVAVVAASVEDVSESVQIGSALQEDAETAEGAAEPVITAPEEDVSEPIEIKIESAENTAEPIEIAVPEVEAEEPREVALEAVQSAESVEAAQKGSVEAVQSVESVEAVQSAESVEAAPEVSTEAAQEDVSVLKEDTETSEVASGADDIPAVLEDLEKKSVSAPLYRNIPLFDKIFAFIPDTTPFGEFVKSLSKNDLHDLESFIYSVNRAQKSDGKDKMFNTPGADITVSVMNKTEDPMLQVMRKEGVATQMLLANKQKWTHVILYFNESGNLVSAETEEINQKTFSSGEWKIVREMAYRKFRMMR